ncbi:MAG: peptidoglycan editing factor PgeF [Thermacetogeniaceae bacterium]
MGFVLCETELPYFTIPRFEEMGVRAVFTTRNGGVSRGPFKSLNLGFHTGDDPESVAVNRGILCRSLGITEKQLCATRQVHGDSVVVFEEQGKTGDREAVEADAQITAVKGIALMCLVADCQAVYICDPVNRVIGLAHAGWRGAVAKIALKCLKKMASAYGTKPKDCLAALSPAAGGCCYEVGEEVVEAVKEAFPGEWHSMLIQREKGAWKLDLSKINAQCLLEAGIDERNIIFSSYCTICRQDLFFSYRGSRGVTGRMAAVIMLL